jgi:hypothetical protein
MAIYAQPSDLGTIYICDETGAAYWSKSSLSAATKQDGIKLINYWINGGKIDFKTAEIVTEQGIRMGEIIPAEDPGALKFILKFNPELLLKFAGLGATVYLQSLCGYQPNQTSIVAELLDELKTLVRNWHRSMYGRNMTAGECNKLHVMFYGMTVAEHIEKVPALQALRDANFTGYLPDICSYTTLKEVTTLRENYIRAKRAGKANPYQYAIDKM